jgi:hypothetical protein
LEEKVAAAVFLVFSLSGYSLSSIDHDAKFNLRTNDPV